MRKLLTINHLGRTVSVGYVSFQPDQSISFGLRDRTYISPRLRERRFLWNAYNRITVKYELQSDPDTLLPVQNPHFTFHPAAMFHLKSNKDRKGKDEAIFEAFNPVSMVLQQQSEMPWSPIDTLTTASELRAPEINTEQLAIDAPILMASCSGWRLISFGLRTSHLIGPPMFGNTFGAKSDFESG